MLNFIMRNIINKIGTYILIIIDKLCLMNESKNSIIVAKLIQIVVKIYNFLFKSNIIINIK